MRSPVSPVPSQRSVQTGRSRPRQAQHTGWPALFLSTPLLCCDHTRFQPLVNSLVPTYTCPVCESPCLCLGQSVLMLSVRAGEVFSVPVATDWYLNTNLLSQTTLTEQGCKQQTRATPPHTHTHRGSGAAPQHSRTGQYPIKKKSPRP